MPFTQATTMQSEVKQNLGGEGFDAERADQSAAILNSITAEIAVLSRDGVIVAVNQAWRRFALENALRTGEVPPYTDVGTDYLSVCKRSMADPDGTARAACNGIEAVLEGKVPSFSMEYTCHSASERRWFSMVVTPLGSPTLDGAVVTHTDVSSRKLDEFALMEQVQSLKRALQESRQQRDALMKEIHHRVKNNLQLISSLLRLEAGRSVRNQTSEPNTTGAFLAMQGRLLSMALLHESVHFSGASASVELGAYLKQLATAAVKAQPDRGGRIQLRTQAVPVMVGMDQATSLGLLAHELISNSLRHGFPDGRGGEIHFRLDRSDDGRHCRLHVSDTGVGLPGDFEARCHNTLGFQFVDDLRRQAGGVLSIASNHPQGVSVEVTFVPIASVPQVL